MLKAVPYHSGTKQSQIIMALCALHNYVHDLEGQKQPGRHRQAQGLGELHQVAAMALSDPNDMEQVRDWITYGLWTPWEDNVSEIFMVLVEISVVMQIFFGYLVWA